MIKAIRMCAILYMLYSDQDSNKSCEKWTVVKSSLHVDDSLKGDYREAGQGLSQNKRLRYFGLT